jgi:Cdc6-like AAA superfamily ATPase
MRALLRASLIQPSLLVITGLGGIGKTSLLSFALRSWLTQEAPPILRVLWAVLRGDEAEALDDASAEQAMAQLLGQLGKQLELSMEALSNNEDSLQTIEKHLLACRQRFVIVLDDVKSEAEGELALKVALSLLPEAQIVVTSRRHISNNQVHRFCLGMVIK